MQNGGGAAQTLVVLSRAADPEFPRVQIPVPLHPLEDAQCTGERLGGDVHLHVVVRNEFAVDNGERGVLKLAQRRGVRHRVQFSHEVMRSGTDSRHQPYSQGLDRATPYVFTVA